MSFPTGANQTTVEQGDFRLLFERNPIPMWIYEAGSLRLLEVNDAALTRYGYTRGEFLGMRITDLRASSASVRLGSEGAPGDFSSWGSWRHRLKDGTVIDVEVAGQDLVWEGKPARVVVVHDVTEKRRAERRIEEDAARAAALADISRALAQASPEYESVLDAAVRRTSELIGDLCMIGIVAGDGGRIDPVAMYHPDPTVVAFVRDLLAAQHDPHDGILGRVIDGGEVVVLPDLGRDDVKRSIRPEALPGVGRIDLSCVMMLPLKIRGEVVGVIALARERARPYVEVERSFAEDLAERVSLAIADARMFRETTDRLEQVQALHTIDLAIAATLDLRSTLQVLLGHVLARMGADAAAVSLVEPGTQDLVYTAGRGFGYHELAHERVRMGQGVSGRATLERRTLVVEDLTVAPGVARRRALEIEGFVSSIAVPLIAKGEVKGVLDVFYRSRKRPDDRSLEFLEAIAAQAAIAIHNAELFEELQRSNAELAIAYDTTLQGWSRALDLRDRETEGHTRRVAAVTVRLARAMGLAGDELVQMHRGALLHDIGKMGLPDSVLLKPGPLTEDEWAAMRHHPLYAFELLSPIPYLRPALDIPYCHHERWNGSGYPRGLAGEDIPFTARIFALADVWDALRSDRSYRRAWSEPRAREYIRSETGVSFDPSVAETFLAMDW